MSFGEYQVHLGVFLAFAGISHSIVAVWSLIILMENIERIWRVFSELGYL